MNFAGKVVDVQSSTIQGNKGAFEKVTMVVTEVKDEYPQTGVFDFIGKSAENVDNVIVGDEVAIEFNLGAKPNADGSRWFNALNGWKCVVSKDAQEGESVFGKEEDDDDLPF